jgi:hypothetical protein
MNPTKSSFRKHSMVLAIASTILLATSGASAKEHKEKVSENTAHVVAHIAFHGTPVVGMAIQKRADDTYYLYVQHSRERGISIVDIAKPDQPKVVATKPWPDPAMANRITLAGDLAMIDESKVTAPASPSSKELVLWDMSNPAAPREVQKFAGVVKWLEDERNFIYVLNADGLWVISEPTARQAEEAASSNYGVD